MKYVVMCHHHFYHLYAWDAKNQNIHRMETSRHWAPLVDRLCAAHVRDVLILDGLNTHTLKSEAAPHSLKFYEFFWWAWHKWRFFSQHAFFGSFYWVWDFRSVIMASSQQALTLTSLTKALEDNHINVHVNSYPLELALAVFSCVSSQRIGQENTALIVVDQEKNIILAFFHKKNLIYIKYNIGDSEARENSTKNTIHDTMNYVEKTTSLRFEKPIMVAETNDHIAWLRHEWPHHQIHSALDFVQEHDAPTEPISPHHVLDRIIVKGRTKRTLRASLWYWRCHASSQRPQSSQGKWRLALWGMVMVAVYHLVGGIYQTYLVHNNYVELDNKIRALDMKVCAYPLSSTLIRDILAHRQKSFSQVERLHRYVNLLRHVLHDQFRLRALFIHENKVRLTLRPITPYAHIDTLVETAYSAGLNLTKDDLKMTSSDIHFQSTPSPLYDDKTPNT